MVKCWSPLNYPVIQSTLDFRAYSTQIHGPLNYLSKAWHEFGHTNNDKISHFEHTLKKRYFGLAIIIMQIRIFCYFIVICVPKHTCFNIIKYCHLGYSVLVFAPLSWLKIPTFVGSRIRCRYTGIGWSGSEKVRWLAVHCIRILTFY